MLNNFGITTKRLTMIVSSSCVYDQYFWVVKCANTTSTWLKWSLVCLGYLAAGVPAATSATPKKSQFNTKPAIIFSPPFDWKRQLCQTAAALDTKSASHSWPLESFLGEFSKVMTCLFCTCVWAMQIVESFITGALPKGKELSITILAFKKERGRGQTNTVILPAMSKLAVLV